MAPCGAIFIALLLYTADIEKIIQSDKSSGMFQLEPHNFEPRKLTLAVIQISQFLGLYRAETARILGIQCEQIGALMEGKISITKESGMWEQALLFAELYNRLFSLMQGDSVKIYHWLRTDDKQLGSTPLLHMVDHDGIENVVDRVICLAGQDNTVSK